MTESDKLNTTLETLVDNDFFEELRHKEYSRLDQNGETYLDFMGGNLYTESLIAQHYQWLSGHVLGNPHLLSGTSMRSSEHLEESRRAVIDFFNAKEYICIFTANATAALKIIGDSYPFNCDSTYLITQDNHNSVNGIREYCVAKGGMVKYLRMDPYKLTIDQNDLLRHLKQAKTGNNLLAFPAQSNVSGVKHNLDYIETAHQNGWDVLLDAAAYVSSSPLDLSVVKPDFVSMSFYKIFGYPTGIGCLLVHKSKFDKLSKTSFYGGNVNFVSVKTPHYNLSSGYRKFEDGTVDYLGIPVVKMGLDFIQRIGGTARIKNRIASIRRHQYESLKSLSHENGQVLITFYGDMNSDDMGNTMVMNFNYANGDRMPIEWIQEMATKRKISVRTGCFCNPGIDEVIHRVDEHALEHQYQDVVEHPETESFVKKFSRGSVRISFGAATTSKDLVSFVDFCKSLLQ
jgi:molybdenum cofactor sulfurtransferase